MYLGISATIIFPGRISRPLRIQTRPTPSEAAAIALVRQTNGNQFVVAIPTPARMSALAVETPTRRLKGGTASSRASANSDAEPVTANRASNRGTSLRIVRMWPCSQRVRCDMKPLRFMGNCDDTPTSMHGMRREPGDRKIGAGPHVFDKVGIRVSHDCQGFPRKSHTRTRQQAWQPQPLKSSRAHDIFHVNRHRGNVGQATRAKRCDHRIAGLHGPAALECNSGDRGNAIRARHAIGIDAHDDVRRRIGEVLPSEIKGIALAAMLGIVALPNNGTRGERVRGGLVGAIVGDYDDQRIFGNLLFGVEDGLRDTIRFIVGRDHNRKAKGRCRFIAKALPAEWQQRQPAFDGQYGKRQCE